MDISKSHQWRLAVDVPVQGHSPLALLQWNRAGSHGGTPTQLTRERVEKCSTQIQLQGQLETEYPLTRNSTVQRKAGKYTFVFLT